MPLNATAVEGFPLHFTWLATALTVGVGLTITVAVLVGPTQVPDVGVMVNVTVCGTLVVLVSVPLILPLPMAAMPVTLTVLFLVQAYVVLATVLVSTIGVMAEPEQVVCDAGVAVATGFPLTVNVTSPGLGALYNIFQFRPSGKTG